MYKIVSPRGIEYCVPPEFIILNGNNGTPDLDAFLSDLINNDKRTKACISRLTGICYQSLVNASNGQSRYSRDMIDALISFYNIQFSVSRK